MKRNRNCFRIFPRVLSISDTADTRSVPSTSFGFEAVVLGVDSRHLRAENKPITDLGFLEPVELEQGENRRLKNGLIDELVFVIRVDAVEKGRGKLGSSNA